MALYVADLVAEETVVDVVENEPTYPPGIDPPPEFAFVLGEDIAYQVSGESGLEAARTRLNAVKLEEILLVTPGSAMAYGPVWPAIQPESVYDLEDMVFVDEGAVEDEGRLHGKPWLSGTKTWQEDDEGEMALTLLDEDAVWWKTIFTSASESSNYYWDGSTWIGPYASSPDYEEYPADRHPSTSGMTLAENAAIAIENGFDIEWADEEETTPVWPLDVPTTGFTRLARVGVLIATPEDYDEILITFESSIAAGAGSNRNIRIFYSYGIPDTWEDVLSFTEMTYDAPDEMSTTKEVAVDTDLLTGTDPLFIWFLLTGDHEGDFSAAYEIGYLYDFVITADDEEIDIEDVSWDGDYAKLKIAGTDNTYRENIRVITE